MSAERGGRGCWRCGCWAVLGAVIVVALVVGGVVLWRSDIPDRLGVRQSPARRLLSGEPDRYAAQQVVDELVAAGVDTQGMWVYVLPVEGKPYRALYALLDASAGFEFDRSSGGDVVLDQLVRLATGDAAAAQDIGRVAIDYRDAEGNQVISLTAPTDAIRAYARGEITQEAFMASLEGQIDLAAMAGGLGE
ncbi:MAG: hypothetical protein JXA09_05895 [Anaerolineae bacterium]|nr:hypothetical protein [Anaerolineae bacterium]